MPNKRGIIRERYRFPWYMPWKVDELSVKATREKEEERRVEWNCRKSDFIVMFPKDRNPLVEGNEIHSVNREARATVKPYDNAFIQPDARFQYCILLIAKGEEDVVEGTQSPPTMIIE